ncbi:MAG: transketolase C-terminal domain-containing protein [Chlamydiota bacterium]|jgi:pyruvate dehydrogenase E1 component beta subunit
MRCLKYSEAILEATDQLMEADAKVYVMGLGVPDPKGIFGTTSGLQEKYGPDRVLDMPTSENAMTGVAIGSSILGSRPIMTHQRVDFFLLALDQLINNAAKWNNMFGEQMTVPLVIRLIIGRGWGQGPQHSQALFSLFSHIPGLKVVAPANAYDAKGLLISAVEDDYPVVYLEHRWLHNTTSDVPRNMFHIPLGKAKVVIEGNDLTVVSFSHMTLEALKAYRYLQEEVSLEIVDLCSLSPLDKETILKSVKKTKRLLVLEPDWKSYGIAAEIIASVVEELGAELKSPPARIAYPDEFSPTSWALSNHYYPTAENIALKVLTILNKKANISNLMKILQTRMQVPLDTPDKEFVGPF